MIALVLIQGTMLLAIGLVIAKWIDAHAARAHAVLVAAILSFVGLPWFAVAAWHGNWGFLPARDDQMVTIATDSATSLAGDSAVPTFTHVERELPIGHSQSLAGPSSPPQVVPDARPVPQVLIPPVAPNPVQVESFKTSGSRDSDATTTKTSNPASAIWPWRKIVIGLWALAFGLAMMRLVLGIVRAANLRRQAETCRDHRLLKSLEDASRRVGLNKRVELLVSRDISCPVIWCWRRPAIIVPQEIQARSIAWDGLLMHELAHLQRRDHWTSLLLELSFVLLPWHPLLWVARRWAYQYSERACDDRAVAQSADVASFAESILAFAPHRRLPLLAPMASSAAELKTRIRLILESRRVTPRAGVAWHVLLVTGALVSISTVGMIRSRLPVPSPEKIESSPAEAAETSASPGPDPAEPQDAAPGREDVDRSDWNNAQWVAHLTSRPADSRWFVGARLGGELARMPPERTMTILNAAWDDIPPSVAQQMLKGFHPGFRFTPTMSGAFFEVMNLGMRSRNPRTRSFATTYLRDIVFRNFEYGGENYDQWHSTIDGLTSAEVVAIETRRFAKRLGDPQQTSIEDVVQILGDSYSHLLKRNETLLEQLVATGVRDRLKSAVDMRLIDMDDHRVEKLIEALDLPGQKTVDDLLEEILAGWEGDPDTYVRSARFSRIASRLGDQNDPKIIPVLIGLIDADNSYDTVYGVGYFGLRQVTNVPYSAFHDGAWWRRWWEQNKGNYPAEVQAIKIPELPRTAHGKNHQAFPAALDTLDGKVEFFAELVERGEDTDDLISAIADEHADSDVSIPIFIGLIDADNSHDSIYTLGYYGLRNLTGISWSRFRDGAAWRRWWEENKEQFSEEAQQTPIPDLPKTAHGKQHEPYPEQFLTFDGLFQWLINSNPADDPELHYEVIQALERQHELQTELGQVDPSIIPKMIAVIESDNSYNTVYGIGFFVLGRMTDVKYNPLHDGPWWRRWWERNKERYGEAAGIPIPTLPKTPHGEAYVPFPADLDTYDGLVNWILEGCPSTVEIDADDIGELMMEFRGDIAIPFFLAWYEAARALEDEEAKQYLSQHVKSFLNHQIETRFPEEVTVEWLRGWWEAHKGDYSEEAQNASIPDLKPAVEKWLVHHLRRRAQQLEEEFEGFPAARKTVGEDERKTYFQIGPREGVEEPEDGWKVLLILPGGSGSADFHPFCRRIHKHALPESYIAIQLVAPVWSDDENRMVWPTENLNPQDAEFTTEAFIREVMAQVGEENKIDERFVFAMGWSSGGPAVYADSVNENSPVTGSYVAMSVFRPRWMNSLRGAEGHPYFILHSPQDWIDFDEHAKGAESELREHGASVRLKTYRGGHGWREDPYGNIRAGVNWLVSEVARSSADDR